ncbi:MAG: isoaspartyl peptidase/L-asparaginase [Planctomycetota bacterium]|jgi:N4-(beta-N-acetylglucosaminyl)-L-asparaginase
MSDPISRRGFLRYSAAASASPLLASSGCTQIAAVTTGEGAPTFHVPPKRRAVTPTAIGSGNAKNAVKIAVEEMAKGKPPVDAAVAGINPVEEDPNDMSVGYGGLPNEDGIVELDNIKTPSKVALLVMRRTDHVLLVGEGALRFARAHGLKEHDLLTDRARRRWLSWKENLSSRDDWVSPREAGSGRRKDPPRPSGTIHVSAINEHGDLGACTSTSGLSFKIPGRVGDSPLIGCGLYTDNDHGSAGSTGRGEAVILSNGSAYTVYLMEQGMAPKDACLAACKRIVRLTRVKRLVDATGRPNFNVAFYAVNKKGVTGAATIHGGGRYSVMTANGPEIRSTAHLF